MNLTIPTHIGFKLPHLLHQHNRSLNLELTVVKIKKPPKNAHFYGARHPNFLPNLRSTIRFRYVSRVSSDGGSIPQQASTSEWDDTTNSSSNSADSYIGLFVRMLGLDNDPLDREEAIIALWKYSLGGKQYIDSIMQFRGCLNLTVNLLKAENSSSTCEAAAGLLRMISSVNLYRETVAESGAIEEITGLLTRSSSPSDVKEQNICTLWNLSVDEKIREKIANPDIVTLLIRFLDDEDIKVKEAAGGVLANLALSRSNHSLMVEAGVISKLAEFLKINVVEGSTVIRKEAKNTLLELCKDDYYRILIIEEGLLLVPLVGASAYKSFKPSLYSWPSLPDGMDVKKTWKAPSRYGASELLLGLNIEDKDMALEEIKMNSIVSRTRQQFLARVGAIETEDKESLSTGCSQTLLPWTDGVARLVLILGLEDERAVASAGRAIADASVNEYLRVSFKEAGAVKYLARMLEHPNDAIRSSAVLALERLSISNSVCQTIGDQDYLPPLISSLMQPDISESLLDKVLDILARVLDPSKKMKSKFYDLHANADADGNDIPLSPTFRTGIEMFDSTFLERLVDIMKSSSSSSNLQRKAVSILESVSVTDEPSMDKILPLLDIQSGLLAVFHQNFKTDTEQDLYYEQPEKHALETEESGMAISAASRLLTKLLDYEQFRSSLNPSEFIDPLRRILKSKVIPVQNKDWIAACLVKLVSISLGPYGSLTNPINTEVTVHERIPRMIGDLKNKSSSSEEIEEAVVELNRLVSEGATEAGRAVAAAEGGIDALRRVIEEGRPAAVEAAVAIMYNLSMEGENREAVVAAGVGPALRRIVMAERPHWIKALHLLRILS